MKRIPAIVAISRSSRYGRPRHIAFATMDGKSVKTAMAYLNPRGRYSLWYGEIVLKPADYVLPPRKYLVVVGPRGGKKRIRT